jgi:peptidoglycan hydrolase CwlO-like protein
MVAKLKIKMAKKNSKDIARSKDIPATLGMLHHVRDDLKASILSLEHKMNSKFKSVDAQFKDVDARFDRVDARFNQVDARFNEVDARFDRMDAKLEKMDSKIDAMSSKIHQMHLLAEEQRGENRIVLDGLIVWIAKNEQLDERVTGLEKTMADFKRR